MKISLGARGVTGGLVVMIAAAVILAACGTGPPTNAPAVTASPATSTATEVTVTESEYRIDLSAATSPAGKVTFHIKNAGTMVHEFVVIKTDLTADKVPLASSGVEVDEDATGLTAVDEVEDIAAGASADLDVDLAAGHYVLICNIPGHYPSGMHVDFTVGG
jgi:uncharacterized cupredoxin-like copper-binding protein